MQAEKFSEIFPLFDTADSEILDWLLSVAVERDYPAERTVLTEDTWGNAVCFILSGWVKVRHFREQDTLTLAVFGRGDFFGEMAILDESPRSTEVVSLTAVRLLSIPAQRFIQFLFKDSQLHHRMLQITVKRLRQLQQRLQLYQETPSVRVANVLTELAETYGSLTETGLEIFNIPDKDIADLAGLNVEETSKVLDRLKEKGWLQIDSKNQVLNLTNPKQIAQLAGTR